MVRLFLRSRTGPTDSSNSFGDRPTPANGLGSGPFRRIAIVTRPQRQVVQGNRASKIAQSS
jgi:hypothetical protein